jgi:hypothetical protein
MKAGKLFTAICCFAVLMVSIRAMAVEPVSLVYVRNMSFHPVLRNSSDQVEVRAIRLVNGVYERGRRNVDLNYEFLRSGQIVLCDVNLDGRQDALVVLYHIKGDRQMTQLAVVLNVNGKPLHAASREFGEGTEVMDLSFSKSFVKVPGSGLMAQRGVVSAQVSNEKYCNGQGKTVYFIFDGNRLYGQDPFNLK